MYSQSISSKKPSLFVFLVDTSASMSDEWVSSKAGLTLSDSAATAINEILYDLATRACMKEGIVDRVHVGVYSYGDDAVSWALPRGLPEGRGWVTADDWVTGYTRREEVPVSEDAGRVITRELPIWIEPQYDGSTPMCAAFRKASEVVHAHMEDYPDSFPPIVINITDGWPTDTGAPILDISDFSPDWGELRTAASEITSQACQDGYPLLLNIHLTSHHPMTGNGVSDKVVFPTKAPADSHESVQNMVSISSTLPANFVIQGRNSGYDLEEGARGLIMNADRTLLSDFLRIGTTLTSTPAKEENHSPKSPARRILGFLSGKSIGDE